MLCMDLSEVLAMYGLMDEQATEDVRAHFTNIGCIMEDASAVALIWDAGNPITLPDRYRRVAAAHNQIGIALEKIKAAIEGS